MKPANFLLILLALAIARSALAEDTLFFSNGEKRVGNIVSVDPVSFRLEVPLPGPAGAAPVKATVTIPRRDVQQIEFAADPERERFLAQAQPSQLPQMQALWKRWEPFLGIARSPAGDVGLACGNLLLASGSEDNARTALDMFHLMEASAWSQDVRMAAKQGRLRAMIATGNAADAVNDARELAKLSEDPAVLVEAKFILAEAADKELRKLIADNPRWEEDVNVIPERHRLYHSALDEYLFPALFFGSGQAAAARGLWGAVGVYNFTGEQHHALECARDIVRLYPSTPQAAKAKEFIDSLPEDVRSRDPEKEFREQISPSSDAKTKNEKST